MAPDYIYFASLPSTHEYAIDLLTKTKPIPFTAIVAGHQSAGRGRFDRTWTSETDANALFSVIYYPSNVQAQEIFLLNMCATLATIHILALLHIDNANIKWPNDVLVDGEKICGTLIQNQLTGKHISSSVVSAGINVNQRSWPAPIRATSLALQIGSDSEVHDIIERWILAFKQLTHLLSSEKGKQSICDQWLNHLIGYNIIGHFQDKDGEVFQGTIRSINTNGKLRVERDQTTEHYSMDELRQLL